MSQQGRWPTGLSSLPRTAALHDLRVYLRTLNNWKKPDNFSKPSLSVVPSRFLYPIPHPRRWRKSDPGCNTRSLEI